MACYHPLKAFSIGLTNKNKVDYKICSYNTDHIELINNNWIPVTLSNVSSLAVKYVRDFIEIPCGKCLGCRLDYSRQWANRCMLEASYYGEDNFFITLTYNDIAVPKSCYPDPDTGEAHESLSLRKRDVQLFLKRLRKKYAARFPDRQLRYYLCGEYGGQTYRPHYHLLLFNLYLDDLKFYKNERNFTYYNSDFISDCWTFCTLDSCKRSRCDTGCKYRISRGHAVVAPLTWETCAYTARYCMKKVGKDYKSFYETFNLQPEFVLMSRKPGIGYEYFKDHKEHIYEYDKIYLNTEQRGMSFKPPRYFDKLYDLDDSNHLADIKENRCQSAQYSSAAKLQQTSLSYLDLLQVEEDNKINKTQILFNRGDCNG